MGTIQNAINSTIGEAAKIGAVTKAVGAYKQEQEAKIKEQEVKKHEQDIMLAEKRSELVNEMADIDVQTADLNAEHRDLNRELRTAKKDVERKNEAYDIAVHNDPEYADYEPVRKAELKLEQIMNNRETQLSKLKTRKDILTAKRNAVTQKAEAYGINLKEGGKK